MLPEGWHRSTLGEIARITSGGTPDRSEPSYWGGSVPWVTTGEIQFNTITDTAEKITDAGLKKSSAKLFPPGTLLMAMYGQGRTRGQVAKLAIEASTNQNSAAILLNDGHDPDFYFQFLSWKYDEIRDFGHSGGVSHLNAGLLKLIGVPVAPIDEQRQVAQILGTWDRAIRTARRQVDAARSHLDALAKVVLMGHRRLTSVAEVGRLQTPYGSIPADWQYVRVGEIATELSRKPLPPDMFPVLSCTKHDGLVDSLSYFKKRVFSEDTSNYKVAPRGSFVYATNHIEEGSIGYQDLYDFGLVSPIYTVFRTGDSICDGYLYAVLKTEHYRQIFSSATNASVDRRGSLRWKDFSALRVPVPPIAEQRAIARLLLDAGRERDLLQAHLSGFQQEKAALMADLLTGKRRVRLPAAETAP